MKAAASENKKVNIKCFRGTPNDLLDLYKKVPKDPLVQSQKYITFKNVSALVGKFYQGKNSSFSDIHIWEKHAGVPFST